MSTSTAIDPPRVARRAEIPEEPSRFHQGMNLRECLAEAARLGARVEPIRRTGEIRLSHPRMRGSGPVNARRKDAPRRLVVWLRLLERVLAARFAA